MAKTSEGKKKKKSPFIFLCMPFILFSILKKKFKFRISKFENSKKKRKLALTSKKKKIQISNFEF